MARRQNAPPRPHSPFRLPLSEVDLSQGLYLNVSKEQRPVPEVPPPLKDGGSLKAGPAGLLSAAGGSPPKVPKAVAGSASFIPAANGIRMLLNNY